nr:hypothetical protein [Tanacetum cinerariifolium]
MYCTNEANKNILDPAKQMSKILLSCPKLGVAVALDQSGIRPTPESVEEVLKRFSNAGMLIYQFFDWASKQRHYEHSIRAYHAMVESLAKIRQYEIMWDLINSMRTKGLLNIETFCIIMRRYARAQKVEEAIYTFNVMEKYNVPPNLAAFNGLLSALCKSKNVRKAQEIFNTMKDRFVPDQKTEMISDGSRPDIVTYGIMVDILCKAGRVDEAIDIIKDMEYNDCQPTSFIYSILVHTYGIENWIEDAVDTFLEMEKNGVKADVAPNSRTCNILLNHLIERKETDEAFKVFRRMIKICTYTIMIKMFSEKGDIEMALKVWKFMKKKQFVPSLHTYSVLINGLCENQDASLACMLMEEMIEKGIRPPRLNFGRLRKLLIEQRRDEVLDFLQQKLNLLKTQAIEGKTSGTSFEAMSHAPVNVSKKSKRSGRPPTERAAGRLLGPKKLTSQKMTRADTGNPNQRNADQTVRTTCPNLGCAKKPIRSQQGSESSDNYEVLRKAFLGNFSQQKYIKDPVESHHIKQREGESTEAFMERFKAKSMHVNGAPECMKIFGFMHDNGGQENPIVIEAEVEGHLIHRMYVDGGSTSEVFYEHCFNKLHLKIKNQMIPATTPLLGFSGEISWPLGKISLMVSLGDEEHSTSSLMNFMVVRSSSPYNGIIGRPGLQKIQAVSSIARRMLKFLVERGIVMIRSNIIIPAECRMVAKTQNALPPREPTAMERIKVAIHPEYPKQTKPVDMTGVPRSIAEHRLNIREGYQPIRQKIRGQAPDRNKAIQEEVAKLVEAEIMRELHYHDWLSNPIMRLVDKAFEKHIGRNLEVYVDDLVIKSYTEHEILRDIKETFHNLRRINMKLTPKNAHLVQKKEHSYATPRTSIRGQILADFIAERQDEEDPPMEAPAEEVIPEPWTLFTDGSSCLKGSGAGLVLTSPKDKEFTYELRFEFGASNNEAEYEALIAGLRIAKQMAVKNLVANMDSLLVANQINGSYEAK